MPLLTVTPHVPESIDLDAYLREKTAPQEINLDNYLHEKEIAARASGIGPGLAFGRGATQGATLGFGDEIEGAVQATGRKLLPDSLGGGGAGDAKRSFSDLYKESRNVARDENTAAERASPKTYIAGQVAGSLAPTVAGGGIAGKLLAAVAPSLAAAPATSTAARLLAAVGAAGQGAVQGAGYSNADTTRGLAGDTALGAGVGLAGYGAGTAAETLGGKAAGAFARLRAVASSRAAKQAADEGTARVASLAGKLGGETQKGNRIVENLIRQETPLAPAEQQAASGLLDRLEQSNLQALPSQAQTIASRTAELQAAQSALPAGVAARTAELSKSQFGKDAFSYAKAYAEPLVAAAVVDRAADAAGLDPRARAALDTTAGIVFGRTRAGKALMSRLGRPGNQIGMANVGEPVAETAGQLLRRLLQTSPAAATPMLQQLIDQ